jgi:hypothetical protein
MLARVVGWPQQCLWGVVYRLYITKMLLRHFSQVFVCSAGWNVDKFMSVPFSFLKACIL